MTKHPKKKVTGNPEMEATMTPLEQVVGFKVAEETYDLLNFREQLIVDLLCAGLNQAQIGQIFEVSQPSISASVRRIRVKLALSRFKVILDAREYYRGNR